MRLRPFQQVDVFTEVPYRGNALAVVLDGTGLSDQEMQHFCNWTNLSEATFLLPPTQPGADYRVRIFCPGRELPFAGHPTLGTARAWLDAGGTPSTPGTVIQQCPAGLIPVQVEGETLAFASPPRTRSGPVDPALVAELVEILGIGREHVVDAEWLDNGPGWVGLLLDSAETVLGIRPDAWTASIIAAVPTTFTVAWRVDSVSDWPVPVSAARWTSLHQM